MQWLEPVASEQRLCNKAGNRAKGRLEVSYACIHEFVRLKEVCSMLHRIARESGPREKRLDYQGALEDTESFKLLYVIRVRVVGVDIY